MNHEPIKLDTLVELQDQYSNVYPMSPTGARGWVRARRELPKTDPEVYIEWDANHWRYHGEKDGWTFEHHFRPVDDAVPDMVPDMTEILTEAHRQVDPERCLHCGGIHDNPQQFIDVLLEAQEAAVNADGYFIVTLTPEQKGEVTVYEPHIYSQTLSDMAEQMIETQLLQIAAQIFERHMIERISNMERPQDGPGR